MAHGRDLEDAEAASLELRTHERREVERVGHVHLVECDELRAFGEGGLALRHRVGVELGEDHVEIGDRVATGLERRAVEHVQQR